MASNEYANIKQVTVQWFNPHTTPQNGQPRKVYEKFMDRHDDYEDDPDYQAVRNDPRYCLGSGYSTGLDFYYEHELDPSMKAKRTWSKEAKAKKRQTNLRKRVQKRFKLSDAQLELFSEYGIDAEMEKEIEKRKDYYNGGDEHKVELEKDLCKRDNGMSQIQKRYTQQLKKS